MINLDREWAMLLNSSTKNSRMRYFMKFMAIYAGPLFTLIYGGLLIYVFINLPFILLPTMIGPAVSLSFVILIRYFINRKRPFEVLEIVPLIIHGTGCSFPSKHGTSAFAIAFAMLWVHPLMGGIIFILAVLTGISRIMAGVHYPSDILGGMMIAFLVTQFIHRLL